MKIFRSNNAMTLEAHEEVQKKYQRRGSNGDVVNTEKKVNKEQENVKACRHILQDGIMYVRYYHDITFTQASNLRK